MTLAGDNNQPDVTITTDGAARGNPGPGGWAALLESAGGKEKLLSGGELGPTTNNAMELEAVIQGLGALRKRCRVLLRCDSQYVLGGIERLMRGEVFSETRKNGERWEALGALLGQHDISLKWVRGHVGDTRNERVDRAANAQANGFVIVTPPEHLATHAGARWTLEVQPPGTNRPARWILRAGEAQRTGEVAVGKETQPTAVYRALLAGMEAARALPNADNVALEVQSNYELLIKQCNGEWRVKNPAQQPLAAEVARLRTRFAAVSFAYSKAEVK